MTHARNVFRRRRIILILYRILPPVRQKPESASTFGGMTILLAVFPLNIACTSDHDRGQGQGKTLQSLKTKMKMRTQLAKITSKMSMSLVRKKFFKFLWGDLKGKCQPESLWFSILFLESMFHNNVNRFGWLIVTLLIYITEREKCY